jgi:hypothetical protein
MVIINTKLEKVCTVITQQMVSIIINSLVKMDYLKNIILTIS